MTFDEFNGVVAGRDEDRYRGPLDRIEPPLRWPLRRLLGNAIVFAVGLAGLCALVLLGAGL